MGQKIHPTGFRLAVSRNWASRWYASNRDFAGMLAEDIKVREFLKAKLKNAAVSRILIERPAKNARITIFSARPGVVIGKKGEDIEKDRKSTRLNSSHLVISYAVFCLKKQNVKRRSCLLGPARARQRSSHPAPCSAPPAINHEFQP